MLQINSAYNSNRIEGSRLTHDQTQHLFDKNEVLTDGYSDSLDMDDLQETLNHFKGFDFVLNHVDDEMTSDSLKKLHYMLKQNTSDEQNPLIPVGDFKSHENIVGDAINPVTTTHPDKVEEEITNLLRDYNDNGFKYLEDIIDFHVKFESIHPFADGNGRVGRLIILKEAMKYNHTPSLILSQHNNYYKQGLKEYREGSTERLIETFKAGQDYVKTVLDKLNFTGNINDNVANHVHRHKDNDIER